MERLSRMPAAVFGYFVVAFYLTGFAHVEYARGHNTEALTLALLALAGTLLMLRAAEKPAR